MRLCSRTVDGPSVHHRRGTLAILVAALVSVGVSQTVARAATPPPSAPDERAGHPPTDPRAHPVRGGFLPADRLADRVADPSRYKVRPAPPGYVWVHVARDLILAQDRSGLIVDIVEGVYP